MTYQAYDPDVSVSTAEQYHILETNPKTIQTGLHQTQASVDLLEHNVGQPARAVQNLDGDKMKGPQSSSATPLQPSSESVISSLEEHHSQAKRERYASGTRSGDPRVYLDSGDKRHNLPAIRQQDVQKNTIPSVRACDWDTFKNRYSEEDGRYAIETCVANLSIESQIQMETERRIIEGLHTPPGPAPAPPPPPPPPPPAWENGIQDADYLPRRLPYPPPPGGWKDEPWIQRIRINSQSVMGLLGSCSPLGKRWKGRPRTFIRPFRYLLHVHDLFKDKVKAISESNFDPQMLTRRIHDGASGSGFGNKDEEPESEQDVFEDLYDLRRPGALKELRCYIDFIEEHLIPTSNQFHIHGHTKPDTVRFSELDYLFEVGKYVYIKYVDGRGKIEPTQQRIKRICGINGHSFCTCSMYHCEHRHSLSSWSGVTYFLDYDGESYGMRSNLSSFSPWEGEIKIDTLWMCPLDYVTGTDSSIVAQSISDGKNFVNHISDRYSYYSGWSLTKDPVLQAIMDPKTGLPMKNPEHIESEVLIDFEEAFDSVPDWRPALTWSSPPFQEESTIYDEKPDNWEILEWDGPSRQHVKKRWEDVIHIDRWTSEQKYHKLFSENSIIRIPSHPSSPTDIDLALLPRRMFAYAVWDRKFVPIDTRYLKRSRRQGEEGEAFAQLQIQDHSKKLISALLQSHFRKNEIEAHGIEVPTQDLIRGKGRGVVILLHGVPGVGKTATAEAVSQKWKKPLFPITCGDLGTTPERVESSLKEIFRLAYRWDCVLLLDEADVFIAQREKGGADLQRNALVSVFLRMLEYYNGVLFLTTNRVGVLDEAVKSRVHLHLKYHPLNRDQTVQIFKHNIQRLRVIEEQRIDESTRLSIAENDVLAFALEHYNRNARGAGMGLWNGRQIRNAFLIAAALAHHDGDLERESNPDIQKQLRASHFELVHQATMSYDEERAETLGYTDNELASGRLERVDERAGASNYDAMQAGSYSGRPSFGTPQYAAARGSAVSQDVHGMGPGAYPSYQSPQPAYTTPAQHYSSSMGETRNMFPANEPRNDTVHSQNQQQYDHRGGGFR